MMLGGEDNILHTCSFGCRGPFGRVEMSGVKGGLQVLISRKIVVVAGAMRTSAHCPAFIFRADAPAFHDAPLAIGAPMHEQSELAVLPLCKFLFYQRVDGRHVGLIKI